MLNAKKILILLLAAPAAILAQRDYIRATPGNKKDMNAAAGVRGAAHHDERGLSAVISDKKAGERKLALAVHARSQEKEAMAAAVASHGTFAVGPKSAEKTAMQASAVTTNGAASLLSVGPKRAEKGNSP